MTLARADGASTTLTAAFDVTVTFTEANGLQTTGEGAFAAADLEVTDGSATVTATSDPLVWTATITPNTGVMGNVVVNLPGDRVRDLAGNGNAAAATLRVRVDNDPPRVASVKRDDGNGNDTGELTSADTVWFRVTFSEPVDGAMVQQFAVTGTTAPLDFVLPHTSTRLTVKVTGGDLPIYHGEVALIFRPGRSINIQDAVGNRIDTTLPIGEDYETYTLDNAAPDIASIERHDGTNALDEVTTADSLTFRVTFDEDVLNVDAGDFDATGTTGEEVSVDPVSGNAAQYIVTVSGGNLGNYEGVVGLALSPERDITDLVGIPVVDPKVLRANETYTVDTIAPTVTSFERHDGTEALERPTTADTLTFRVTFSESVENVDKTDFAVTASTATVSSVTLVPGEAAQYIVTVSGGNLADYDGNVRLAFAERQDIADAPGNALTDTSPSGVNQGYLLDNTPPTVVSVQRDDGNGNDPGEHTNADTVQFRVTFSEPVKRAGRADFAVTGTTAYLSLVRPSAAAEIRFEVRGGDLAGYNGEVALILHPESLNIEDLIGHPLDTTLPIAEDYQTYTIDNDAPGVVSIERHDGTSALDESAKVDSLTFRVTFDEDMQNVDAGDFDVTGTTVDAVSVDPVSGDAARYIVTVAGGSLGNYEGRLGLAFASEQDASDLAGNPLVDTGTTGANETYTVDTIAPTVASIERHDGSNALGQHTNADTLTFRVTFSEDVAKVEAADFDASGHQRQTQ